MVAVAVWSVGLHRVMAYVAVAVAVCGLAGIVAGHYHGISQWLNPTNIRINGYTNISPVIYRRIKDNRA